LGASPLTIDIWGARASLIVSAVGVLFIAITSNFKLLFCSLLVYAIGSALPVFTLSLVKDPVISEQEEAHAQDYSLVMLAKTTGMLVGVPIMTVALFWGFGQGGALLGLPFYVSAVTYLLAAVAVWMIRKQGSGSVG